MELDVPGVGQPRWEVGVRRVAGLLIIVLFAHVALVSLFTGLPGPESRSADTR